jgi:hypothetical protein
MVVDSHEVELGVDFDGVDTTANQDARTVAKQSYATAPEDVAFHSGAKVEKVADGESVKTTRKSAMAKVAKRARELSSGGDWRVVVGRISSCCIVVAALIIAAVLMLEDGDNQRGGTNAVADDSLNMTAGSIIQVRKSAS